MNSYNTNPMSFFKEKISAPNLRQAQIDRALNVIKLRNKCPFAFSTPLELTARGVNSSGVENGAGIL